MLEKVFVYGSLRKDMFNYNRLLKGKVKHSEIGMIKGSLYHLENKGYPAIIEGEELIVGEVMEFYNFKEVLLELDELEGFEYGDIDSEYLREEVEVVLKNGNREKCYFYKYNEKAKENKEDSLLRVSINDWKEYMEIN